jgi:secernin
MYGAEIGVNEYGVCIGNEALMTKVKPPEKGLTGMDLLRLALERSRSAKESKDTIINLLETYGQGGACGYRHNLFYMNSYIIADKSEAYVLECVEKHWAWKKITDYWSISNKISLENDYDEASPGLIKYAQEKGWCKAETDFNYTKCYSNKLITWGAAGKDREQCNREHLKKKKGNLTISDFMSFLRHHSDDPEWTPDKGGLRMTVCAHASNNLTKGTQSVSSLVAEIDEDNINCYVTGASNPCISPFFPVFSNNTDIPQGYKIGGEFFDPKSYWWKSEQIHRKAIMNFTKATNILKPKLAKYEVDLISSFNNQTKGITQEKIDSSFKNALSLINDWEKEIDTLPDKKVKSLFKNFWKKYNDLNKII